MIVGWVNKASVTIKEKKLSNLNSIPIPGPATLCILSILHNVLKLGNRCKNYLRLAWGFSGTEWCYPAICCASCFGGDFSNIRNIFCSKCFSFFAQNVLHFLLKIFCIIVKNLVFFGQKIANIWIIFWKAADKADGINNMCRKVHFGLSGTQNHEDI